MRRIAWVVALTLAATGCGGGDGSPTGSTFTVPDGCNPVGANDDCLLPFPSDFYLVDDPSLPSGHRVEIPASAAIQSSDGAPIDLLSLHPADGFSLGTQILALFPGGVDDSSLITWTGDLTKSMDVSSPTLLVEADTGQLVMHMAELDPRAADDARRGLLIRPMVRLKPKTRYIVAIHGLKDPTGARVTAPEGFRRIRDGHTNKQIESVAKRYASDVFPVIEQLGVAKKDLDLAWDFTTGSEESVSSDMLQVRTDITARASAVPPAVSVVSVTDDVDAHTARIVEATMKVPLYVDSPNPGARLNYDAQGKVVAQGEADVPFTIVIPRSVAARQPGDPPARLLQFGHGFFGSRAEVKDFVAQFADQLDMVVVAADWWGMSADDRNVVITDIATDPSSTARFTDRVHQGMANFIALSYAAKSTIAALPELSFGGGPAYDASTVYFYGISQGAILGGTYMALSPVIQRGVLSVGGADLSLMMFRSQPFAAFLLLINSVAPDALDQQKFALIAQMPFDRIDPITYAPHLLSDTYPGAPANRRLLMQNGIGDAAVPNLGTFLEARALGVKLLQPSPEQVAGVPDVDAPVDGSALELFDFHVDPLPGVRATITSQVNPVHEGVRRTIAGQQQIDRFLKPGGLIEHTCDGPCDPE